MKTTILALLIFLTIPFQHIFSQDTIQNGGFEEWYNPNFAQFWQTTNNVLPPGFVNCTQTSNSHSGAYAMQMKTINMDGYIVPGVLTLGTVGMGFTSGGIPFTGRPIALHLFIRHPSAGDEVFIATQFFLSGEVIGGGSWSTTDSIGDYTEIVIPISYGTSLNPDTVNITLLTDDFTVGSMMQVDDVMFEYTTTGIQGMRQESVLSFYPNPCTDKLYISNMDNSPVYLDVFKSDGQLVKNKQHIEPGNALDLNGLPSGMYIIQYTEREQLFRHKIIKQ